eukprot:CAMPEP_0113584270 /NCGR_PEP_ID=MMETSP0015_2-20120614/33009_1 /TAXON_ID=2838 /ORGANISM="Odontella" /LENGTH=217 /DNA_ID=CAMNT_0000489299 /DNA_START=130 /DNA_END=782 /DNA_ORIENTATION=- /assembly_acc=CAM_ASM_000160
MTACMFPSPRRIERSVTSRTAHGRRWECQIPPTRPFSSGADDGGDEQMQGDRIEIPPPTWSVADLRLTPDSDGTFPASVSDEELHRLARRCLIDVRILPPSDRERLKVELAGMMRCISVVCDDSSSSSSSSSLPEGREFTAEDLYDVPPEEGRVSGWDARQGRRAWGEAREIMGRERGERGGPGSDGLSERDKDGGEEWGALLRGGDRTGGQRGQQS